LSGKRQTLWGRLVLALVMSPIVAGLIGAVLIMLLMLVSPRTGPIVTDAASAAGLSVALLFGLFVAAIAGVIYSTFVGAPFIAVFWLGAHLFTRRRPIDLAAAIALAGALFAQFVFSQGLGLHASGQGGSPEDWRAAFGYTPAFAGLISGAITGLLIASMGYRRPEPSEIKS